MIRRVYELGAASTVQAIYQALSYPLFFICNVCWLCPLSVLNVGSSFAGPPMSSPIYTTSTRLSFFGIVPRRCAAIYIYTNTRQDGLFTNGHVPYQSINQRSSQSHTHGPRRSRIPAPPQGGQTLHHKVMQAWGAMPYYAYAQGIDLV